jgi:hypothetical protein
LSVQFDVNSQQVRPRLRTAIALDRIANVTDQHTIPNPSYAPPDVKTGDSGRGSACRFDSCLEGYAQTAMCVTGAIPAFHLGKV